MVAFVNFGGNSSIFAQSHQRICPESTQFYHPTKHKALESYTRRFVNSPQVSTQSRQSIQIPVVVHVVYPTEAENVSDEQIHSQMAALNRDFNRQNSNFDRVHPDFSERIARVGFSFCLATTDPFGQPTSGITRTKTADNSIFVRSEGNIYYTERGGKDAWNTNQYLNIWVTRLAPNVAGFASKPFENSPEEDGVVLSVDYFGQIGTALPDFNLGRVGTHEVGHYFNLFHPWGSDCSHDDFVADTPTQTDAYNGCPDIDGASCNSRDIMANFMNNSADACLAMFTRGQARRMRAALLFARKDLLNGNVCAANPPSISASDIRIHPNPASFYFYIETGNFDLSQIPFRVYNSQGAKVEEGVVVPNSRLYFPTYRNGVYFVVFERATETPLVRKLLIAN
ncbi:MAG: M43 family zinc metalloprotease [Bacteroidota bacterium]